MYLQKKNIDKIIKAIKNASKSQHEYINNLEYCAKIINDEVNLQKQSDAAYEKLDALVKNGDSKSIYEMAKNGGEGCSLDDLVDAILKLNNSDYIACTATIVNGITEKQFINCIESLIKLKDIEAIVHTSVYCTKSKFFFNSFDVMPKVLDMLRKTKDLKLLQDIVDKINVMQANQKANGGLLYTPYGQHVSTEMIYFKEQVVKIIKQLRVKRLLSDTKIIENVK